MKIKFLHLSYFALFAFVSLLNRDKSQLKKNIIQEKDSKITGFKQTEANHNYIFNFEDGG